MKTLTIIDTFGFFFRAYYALPPLRSRDGFPTGLLTGFINFLYSFTKQKKSNYILFALDSSGDTFRKEISKDYKANRQDAPDDLLLQLKVAISWIEKMGFANISVDGFEADDVIASVTKLAKDEGFRVEIVSSDKDLYQLIDDNQVVIYDWVKKSFVDESGCVAKFGVSPKSFVDFQALVGDSADNIAGVKGVGVKTASKLINEWGSLEGIYQNIENVKPPRVQNLLKEGRESAFLSQKLVRLESGLFETLNFSQFELEDRDYLVALKDEFKRLDMRQALKYITPKDEPQNLEQIEFKVVTLKSKEELFEVLESIPADAVVAFDSETDSLDTKVANLVGFSFAFEESRAFYVPVAHNYLGVEEQVDLADAKDAIAKLFERRVVGQNLKFDLALVYNLFGFERITPESDTMILGWLLDSGSKVGLDFLAKRYLNYEMKSYKDMVKKGENFSSVDIESASLYAGEDALITLKLYNRFLEIFKERLLDRLLQEAKDVEFSFINVLIAMEQEGIKVDVEHLKTLHSELSARLQDLTKEIFSLAGSEFNINSPKQLGTILFEKLELKGGKKTKTGFSTNEATLQKLRDAHPIVEEILEYRELQKLLSTYIKPLTKLAKSDKNSRIYTTFLQTGTATGRLSSKEPNLQNIPVRTALGRKIRGAFVAESGYKLLSIDYSQIELRLLAHFSQDETLLDAFKREEDIHLTTAKKLFGDEAEAKRDFAKSINFGLLYGMGSRKLSNELNISTKEAKEIIENYFEAFPTIRDYIKRVQDEVIKKGFIETLLGRRRYFDYDSASERIKAGILRESVNTLFQGSASDLIKLAMLKIDEVLESENLQTKMLLQIHDELIFEVKEEMALEVGERFQKIMEEIYPLRVNLKCSMSLGDSWEELK